MAKKKLKKNKHGLVIRNLDYEKIKEQYFLKKGVVLTKELFSSDTGLTKVTLKSWEKELPQGVIVLAYLMIELGMDLEQVTKVVYE